MIRIENDIEDLFLYVGMVTVSYCKVILLYSKMGLCVRVCVCGNACQARLEDAAFQTNDTRCYRPDPVNRFV